MRGSRVSKLSVMVALFVAACSDSTGIVAPTKAGSAGANVVTSSQGSMSIVQGQGQIAAKSTFVPLDPAVRVVDLNGNPVANEPVTFTASAATALVGLGTAPASNSFTVNTNSNGVAIVRWKLGSVVEGQTLTAIAGTGGVSQVFKAIGTNTAALPKLVIVQGNQQDNSGTMAGHPVRINPTIQVQDNDGTPIPRVVVDFAPSGNGSVSPTQVTAGSTGLAATVWRLKSTAGANTLTVTATQYSMTDGTAPTGVIFSVTGVANGTTMTVVQGNNQTVTAVAGARFGPKDPAFRITDANGAAVAGAVVKLTFSTGSDNCEAGVTTVLATTDADGIVRTGFCARTTTTGTRTLTATAGDLSASVTGTVTQDLSTTTFSTLQGAGQTATVATTLPSDPTFRLVDNNSQPVAGVAVTFTASGAGTLANGSTSGNTVTVNTDADGRVAVRWTLGTIAGTQTLTVSASTGAATSITATATAGAAASIVKVNGDAQTSTAGGFVGPRDPGVQVFDQYGNKKSGVQVSFTPSGNGSVTASPVTTNSEGIALTRWILSNTPGSNTLTATVVGTSISTTFTATGT